MKLPIAGIRAKLLSRRGIIIGATAVILLMAGVYALWSRITWDNYQTRYETWRTTALDQTRAALALPAANTQERQDKFAALKKTTGVMVAKNTICTINPLVGWQRFIQQQRSREEKCRQITQDFATLGKTLQDAIEYLENDQALSNILGEIPNKPELGEADWAAAAAAWHSAVGKVAGLQVIDAFTPTRQAGQDAINKIDAAWQELLAAHAAKDKGRFTQAQAGLVQSYGALGNVSDMSSLHLKKILQPMQAAYDTAVTL